MGEIVGTFMLKADPATLAAITECNERMARLCAVLEKEEAQRLSVCELAGVVDVSEKVSVIQLEKWQLRALYVLRHLEHSTGGGLCPFCGRKEGHVLGCNIGDLLREVGE